MTGSRRAEDVCSCTVIHQDVVDSVMGRMPDARVLQDASTFFKVMGDGTRFRILLPLAERRIRKIAAPAPGTDD